MVDITELWEIDRYWASLLSWLPLQLGYRWGIVRVIGERRQRLPSYRWYGRPSVRSTTCSNSTLSTWEHTLRYVDLEETLEGKQIQTYNRVKDNDCIVHTVYILAGIEPLLGALVCSKVFISSQGCHQQCQCIQESEGLGVPLKCIITSDIVTFHVEEKIEEVLLRKQPHRATP